MFSRVSGSKMIGFHKPSCSYCAVQCERRRLPGVVSENGFVLERLDIRPLSRNPISTLVLSVEWKPSHS